MVSPISQPPPMLSYADRAKKAARTSSSQNSRKITHSASSSSPPTSASSSKVRNEVLPPQTSETAKKSTIVTGGAALSKDPLQWSNTSAATDNSSNGSQDATRLDVSPEHVESPSTAPTSTHAQRPSPAPTVNVWKARMEQARANPQPSSSAAPHVPPSTHSSGTAQSPSMASAQSASASITRHHHPPLDKVPPNGHARPAARGDPFVVRPQQAPTIPSPPSLKDSETWPAVGTATTPPTSLPRNLSSQDSNGNSVERDGGSGFNGQDKESSDSIPKKSTLIPYFLCPFACLVQPSTIRNYRLQLDRVRLISYS